MKPLYLLISTFVFMLSCNSNAHKEKASEFEKNFSQTYQGLIHDEYNVVMKITNTDGKISGSYFYRKYATELNLSGTISKEGDITLNEFSKDQKSTGTFKGTLTNGTLKGQWISSKDEDPMNFVLQQSNHDYDQLLAAVQKPFKTAVSSSLTINKATLKDKSDTEKIKIYEDYIQNLNGKFDWKAHNELRHLYSNIDKPKSLYHVDKILENKILDSYMLNCISNWNIKDKKHDLAIHTIENIKNNYPQLKYLNAACNITLGDLFRFKNDNNSAEKYYQNVIENKTTSTEKYTALAKSRLLKK